MFPSVILNFIGIFSAILFFIITFVASINVFQAKEVEEGAKQQALILLACVFLTICKMKFIPFVFNGSLNAKFCWKCKFQIWNVLFRDIFQYSYGISQLLNVHYAVWSKMKKRMLKMVRDTGNLINMIANLCGNYHKDSFVARVGRLKQVLSELTRCGTLGLMLNLILESKLKGPKKSSGPKLGLVWSGLFGWVRVAKLIKVRDLMPKWNFYQMKFLIFFSFFNNSLWI